MAKISNRSPRSHRGRPEAHPYDQWLDGNSWEIDPTEDMGVANLDTAADMIYKAAKRRNGRAAIERLASGKILVQFHATTKTKA